jgi:hypothetical protein
MNPDRFRCSRTPQAILHVRADDADVDALAGVVFVDQRLRQRVEPLPVVVDTTSFRCTIFPVPDISLMVASNAARNSVRAAGVTGQQNDRLLRGPSNRARRTS